MTVQIRQGDILLRKVADSMEEFAANPPREARGFSGDSDLKLVAKSIKTDGFAIVGFGEGSGHRHVVEGCVETLVRERTSDKDLNDFLMGNPVEISDEFFMFVRVEGKGRLVHQDATDTVFEEDHGVLDLDPGVYEVTRQIEYDERLHKRYVVD